MPYGLGVTQQSIASGALDGKFDIFYALEASGLLLSSVGGTLTADGTEQTLYIDNEPLGCMNVPTGFIDLDNMLAGDAIVLRIYYRIRDGGSLKLWASGTYSGVDGGLADGQKLIEFASMPNRHGIQITLEQTAGTNRDYDWEIFIEV
jgi:hypothetical protein